MFSPNTRQLEDVLALAAIEREGWGKALADLHASGVPLNAEPNPVLLPLGGATSSGTKVTVDTYVNPPTKIPARVRNLVAADEGYFIEEVLGTIGSPIQGGAVEVEETFPEDFFLPEGESIAPRAPGAEAPRLGSTRHAPKIVRPQSRAGSIEVTDEAKRRNNILAVQRQFAQAANTFADVMQRAGIAALLGALNKWAENGETSRDLEAKTVWEATPSAGLFNVDPKTLPGFDVARVLKRFRDDKVGVRPDTVVMNTEELLFLETVYTGVGAVLGLDAMFARQGITKIIATPLIAKGEVLFLKAGMPGAIGWEVPLGQEAERVATRKSTIYVLEMQPVFAVFDASAILRLTGTDS